MPPKTKRRQQASKPVIDFLRRPVVIVGLAVLAVLIVVLIVLNGGPKAASPAAEIDTAQAYQMYQQKSAYFVDVREQSEWDSFHIPGTTLIPLGQLAQRLNEIPKDKLVVVVCRTGHRSAQGRDILKQAGFTNVTSMAGGVTTWQAQGLPIEP